MDNRLPDNVFVARGPGVLIAPEAEEQLLRVARLSGCVRAAGMPDLHPGRGIPVGAAFAFTGEVHPALVGHDAGCGVRLVATSLAPPSLDALERKLRRGQGEPQWEPSDELFRAVLREGARGLARAPGVSEALAEAAALEPCAELADAEGLPASFADQLGTIGGGNHFAEVARVAEVYDDAAAEALGLARGRTGVLVHSGSRGLGAVLADRFHEPLPAAEAGEYLGWLAAARNFARANRFLIAWRLLRALGAAKAGKQRLAASVVHNDVSLEGPVFVHRKGAAPAHAGQVTVLLGSRGAPSWVLRGLGEPRGLSSIAHGAGRRLGRTEARERLKTRYRRAELQRTKLGSRVLCDDPDLLWEEHPDAYKPVEPVLAAVLAAGLAEKIVRLDPLVTVKD